MVAAKVLLYSAITMKVTDHCLEFGGDFLHLLLLIQTAQVRNRLSICPITGILDFQNQFKLGVGPRLFLWSERRIDWPRD